MGCSLSVYWGRAGRQCYYSGRGERRTMTTQGGVGGGCNRKRYWLMERLLDHTNYLNRFFDWPFLMPKFLRWAENSRLFKIVLSSWTMRVKSKSELVIFWTLREHWKREQNRNSKQEIPWLHGQDVPRTYYFFTVGLVKTNSIQLSLNRFRERNTESYE